MDRGGEISLILKPVGDIYIGPGMAVNVILTSAGTLVLLVVTWGHGLCVHGFHLRWGVSYGPQCCLLMEWLLPILVGGGPPWCFGTPLLCGCRR